MKTKSLREGLKRIALGAALVCGTAQAANATTPVTVNTSDSNGVRVVNARTLGEGDDLTVLARLSRTRANRVLSAQPLRFRVLAADGSVRSETVRQIGHAQLPRGNVRDHTLRVQLAALPGDSISVDWVRSAD